METGVGCYGRLESGVGCCGRVESGVECCVRVESGVGCCTTWCHVTKGPLAARFVTPSPATL